MRWIQPKPDISLTLMALLCSAMLTACSNTNQINRIAGVPENAAEIIQQKQAFRNLYRGNIPYPAHCEQDCYLPHSDVSCQSPAQNCRYTGNQQRPALNSGFAVQWLGHASFKVMTPDGQQLLLDPVTDQFDWPVNWVARLAGTGPRQPGSQLTPAQLANTDAVLYSHLHYDHFNHADIARIGRKARYYLPFGMAAYMPDGGYQITEMAWYAKQQQGELRVHAVPARHFNSRKLFNDQNRALWAGWLIQHGDKKLFFAGDTGYSPHFTDIQQKYGDIDICLLPIASYHGPNYRAVHMTPEDALVAAADLHCKVMIPWGYGNASWQMGDHSSHSPLLRLLHMQQQLQSTVPLLILNEGDSVAL